MGAFVPHEDYPAIVIDNGSSTCRTGIAGDDAPSSVFPSFVGRRKFLLGEDNSFVGNEAQDKRELLSLTYPIEHGIVVNWDDMEKVWDHAFFSELKLSPQQHPILISEPPLNPKGNREKMAQVLFETYMTPASFIALQPMLTKHAIGVSRGLIVSVGDGCIHIVPIVDGHVLAQAVRRADFGGRDLTKHLQQLLYQRGYSFTTSVELEIVREIKEKLCFVGESSKGSLKHSTTTAALKKTFQLPDGSSINLDTKILMCPDVLFKSNGFSELSIVEMIVGSVMDSNIEFRKDLFNMICLSGGTTLFQGFPERLKNELLDLPPPKHPQMRIWTSPKRQLLKWLGGSMLASLSTFQTAWVSRHEYEEYGPQIVTLRCYGE